MSKETITGRVTATKRIGTTLYGNPIMAITLDTDTWGTWHRISDNSGLVYSIDNPEFKETAHTFDVKPRSGRLSGRVEVAS